MHKTLIGLGIAAACGAAMAQSPPASPIVEAVRKAILGNPEVEARYNVFEASVRERDAARGGYLPRVDAGLAGGARSYSNTQLPPFDHDLRTGQANLAITQLLWDGLATRNEVRRLDHARLLRWFEFRDATEQAGLDAATAYYDVVRYRRLVALAEDNYVQHRLSFEQVQSRVKAGVGRGVDLEQVGARLALAESNLVGERANLHDATERYRRIVGDLPAAESTTALPLAVPLPASASEVVEAATRRSPAIEASIENLRSARAAAEARRGAYQPTVEARVRGGWGHNLDGELYQKRDATAEIVLSWNLFDGGADTARERQYAALLTQAENLRDKACGDVRQTAAIAFNDVRRLREQRVHLERNVASIEKARDAYRQQFDIGQRSLLDLLNAENELHDARRAYAMAEADLATAVMRTFAAMGTLTTSLGLSRRDAGDAASGADPWSADGDGSTRCPVAPIEIGGASFEELDARAKALAAARAAPTAASAPAPGAR